MEAVPDVLRAIMNILPDIRMLRVCRELDTAVRANPEYTLWCKCAAAGSVYAHGTVKMFTGRPVDEFSLDCAIEHNNLPAVKYLADDNKKVLHSAAKYGRINIIKQYRADSRFDCEMSMIAVVNNRLSVVEYLVGTGLQIDVLDCDDGEVVEVACRMGNCEAAELLIRAGADADFVLSVAVRHRHENIINMAIACGAVVGRRTLHAACASEYFEMLEQENPDYGLEAACMVGKLSVAEYFISRGAATTGMLEPAIFGDCLDIVKLITSKGEKPTEDDLASAANHPHIAEYFAELGYEIRPGVDFDSWVLGPDDIELN